MSSIHLIVNLSGIVDGHKQVDVPLVGWTINAEAVDFIAEVTITHCFHNSSSHEIEATYTFPLDEQSSVCAFQAEYESGQVIIGKVKEKVQAANEYRQALQQGKKASLLREDRPDVFQVMVGRLGPHQHIKTTLTYITMLKAEGDALCLMFPTRVAPRYHPLSSSQRPVSCSSAIAYGHRLQVSFQTRSNIDSLSCPSHASEASLRILQQGTKGTVTMGDASLGKDITILCVESKAHDPRACVEVGTDESMVGMVTLFPRIEFKDVPCDIFFLIDRSGSMGGQQIAQAAQALKIFLRALPTTCSFDIIGFGDRFSALFGTLRAYSDESLDAATRYAADLRADMGGTEILAPLKYIFQRSQWGRRPRQVFVLTDGQVSNEADIFQLVEQEVGKGGGCQTRVFALGIGDSVSHNLVEGIARAGRGTARFVRSGQDMTPQVLGQLKKATQPAMNDVTVTWNFPPPQHRPAQSAPTLQQVKTLLGYKSPSVAEASANCPSVTIQSFPSRPPPVFDSERLVCFARLLPTGDAKTGGLLRPESVTVTANTPDGPLSVTLPIGDDDVYQGSIAHRLAARAAIREFEEGSRTSKLQRGEVLTLAIEQGLMSTLTSFVAVEETSGIPLPTAPSFIECQEDDACQGSALLFRSASSRSHQVDQINAGLCQLKACSAPSLDLSSLQRVIRRQDEMCSQATLSCGVIKCQGASMREVSEQRCNMTQSSFAPMSIPFGMGSRLASSVGRAVATVAPTLFQGGFGSRRGSSDQDSQTSCSAAPENSLTRRAGSLFGSRKDGKDCVEDQSQQQGQVNDASSPACDARSSNGSSGRWVGLRRDGDSLEALCLQQRAQGRFEADSGLALALGVTGAILKELLDDLATACPGVPKAHLATVLAVAAMRTLYPSRKEVWELIEGKATRWLVGQGLSQSQLDGHLSRVCRLLEA